MGDALTARLPARTFSSKRLLRLAGDERLVEQIRRGSEPAFEVAFERYGSAILGFCRHMLGSREEAEDAVQHTFAAAFHDLQRNGERQITLKPWLYTIARNRCLSILRARREQTAELVDIPTDGLHDQVERRAELRELLGDLRELPEEQRAALLLAEAADLSHAEVAGVLGCEIARVKALVFRARSGLIERRDARETPCADIREQLANLRGGSLRRSELRHHLRHCPGCSDYRQQVRQQRQMLAAALPVVPSLGLKSSVLSVAGIGGGAAGGATAAAGGAAAAGGGLTVGGSVGSAAVAKVALMAVLAGGSVVAGWAAVEQVTGPDTAAPAAATSRQGPERAPSATSSGKSGDHISARGERMRSERSHGRRGAERRAERSHGGANAGTRSSKATHENARGTGGRRLGRLNRVEKQRTTELQRGGNSNPTARGQANQPSSKPSVERQAPAVKAAPQAQPALPQAAPLAAPEPSPSGKVKLSK